MKVLPVFQRETPRKRRQRSVAKHSPFCARKIERRGKKEGKTKGGDKERTTKPNFEILKKKKKGKRDKGGKRISRMKFKHARCFQSHRRNAQRRSPRADFFRGFLSLDRLFFPPTVSLPEHTRRCQSGSIFEITFSPANRFRILFQSAAWKPFGEQARPQRRRRHIEVKRGWITRTRENRVHAGNVRSERWNYEWYLTNDSENRLPSWM